MGSIGERLEEIEGVLVWENSIGGCEVGKECRLESLVGEDGEEYVKVKVVEYEMVSVMGVEGVKLLRKELEEFKKELKNK